MKISSRRTRVPFAALLILLIASSPAYAAGEKSDAERGTIAYDTASNRLTVDVKDRPAREVFARIAELSGAEILIDEKIDRPVTAKMEKLPLDDGLKQLVRGFSHVMIYETDKKLGKPVLVTLKVLNNNKEERGELKPARSLAKESATQNAPATETTARKPAATRDGTEARPTRPWRKRPGMTHSGAQTETEAQTAPIAPNNDRQKAIKERQKERMEKLKQENPKLYKLRMEQREKWLERRRRNKEADKPASLYVDSPEGEAPPE